MLDELETAVSRLGEVHGKEVMIVETAYPWTTESQDEEHNPVGGKTKLLDEGPATPIGQVGFFRELRRRAQSAAPAVTAIFWWEPMWTAPDSPWENMTWLDEDGRPLPIWYDLRGHR